ncbi:MAG: tRNA preQ1(34) S-adenosylmethionine ribosyltransferase-isomerase QueA [Pseudomonadota bacterium]|nr:tRNA preQ1(34) S-adenosylmethionine ribosyltransferase-isomerase QueA [Pseudomonadota bacterium]
MKLEEFSYHLPPALIAQTPPTHRDHSRMLVLEAATGGVRHRTFRDFPEYLREGDVLVVNDSRVIPARLVGRKASGALIEILLLSKIPATGEGECWEVMLKPGKRIRAGAVIHLPGDGRAEVEERPAEKKWRLRFFTPEPFAAYLNRHGRAPLPPYIKRLPEDERSPEDRERYQTIYARIPGSVAAPTAGLHFSPAVLESVRQRGVRIAAVTLHVGYGTFLPIAATDIEDHRMEAEFFAIDAEAAALINGAARVVAVGTTATRALETAADEDGTVRATAGWTSLYIYPGYRFKKVRALLTNFHLPRSSLYLLTCAFGGREAVAAAYGEAIARGYRFYSYGDCMLSIRGDGRS